MYVLGVTTAFLSSDTYHTLDMYSWSIGHVKQGNSVTRNLPPTGSEANTTFPLYPTTRIYIPPSPPWNEKELFFLKIYFIKNSNNLQWQYTPPPPLPSPQHSPPLGSTRAQACTHYVSPIGLWLTWTVSCPCFSNGHIMLRKVKNFNENL